MTLKLTSVVGVAGACLLFTLFVAGCASHKSEASAPIASANATPPPAITLFLVGDSTMSDKPLIPAYPERGWGQLLPMYFKPSVQVANYAVNGRSSRSFIDEGKWQAVVEKIKPGDYVLIQFGHNDENKTNLVRYSEPFTTFKTNLTKYVRDTQARHGIPILSTPVARRKFTANGKARETHGDHSVAVRQVAAELQVPLLDMDKRSLELLDQMGPEQSKRLFDWIEPGEYQKLPEGLKDDSHLNAFGASRICDLTVLEVKVAAPDLAKHFK